MRATLIGLLLAASAPAHAGPPCDCGGLPRLEAKPDAQGRIVGTNRAECIVGTPASDVILGRGGDDVICGEGGNDSIRGGEGADKLFGGDGDDDLAGGGGTDELDGGPGNDILRAGDGPGNTLRGGPGFDLILTSAKGGDTVDAGDDVDRIDVRAAGHKLVCSKGVDLLVGKEARALADAAKACPAEVMDNAAAAGARQVSAAFSAGAAISSAEAAQELAICQAALADATPPAPPECEPGAVSFDVILESVGPAKINVIKVVKSLTGLDLRAAKTLVDSAPRKVREQVTQAEAQAFKAALEDAGAEASIESVGGEGCAPPANPPAGDPGTPTQTEFNVVLLNAGPSKLNVIKVVKSLLGLGLREAKALVDAAPVVVREQVPRETAEAIRAALVDAGAEVEIR